MTSFLTSFFSAITRLWSRPTETDELRELPALVWITDAAKGCTYVNDPWLRFSGRTREETLGAGWLGELHPDDVPVFEAAFEKRQPLEIEYRQRRHDGQFRWMLSRGVPRFDRGGDFCGYIGVALDIHDLRAPRKAPKPKKEDAPMRDDKTGYPDLRLKQILVVDREAATLDFTAELLRQCGARVTIARSATEAILALHQHHDLVVTDNGVQVTEGVMLAQQLRQANGGLPAIVLRKPVDGVELASEIAQALTTRAGEA